MSVGDDGVRPVRKSRYGLIGAEFEEVQPYRDASVFVIRGELDRETALELEDALVHAMSRGVRRLVLNLNQCILVDPEGAVALVEIGRGMHLSGATVSTLCTRADILRRLQLANVHRVIDNFDSVSEALNTNRANLPM